MNRIFVLVLALALTGCGRPSHVARSIVGTDSSGAHFGVDGPPPPPGAGTTVGQGATTGGTGGGTGTGQGGTTGGNPGIIMVDATSADPSAYLKALSLSFDQGVQVTGCVDLKVETGRMDLITGHLELKISGFSYSCSPNQVLSARSARFTLAKSVAGGSSVKVTNAYGTFSTTSSIQFTVAGIGVEGRDPVSKAPVVNYVVDFRQALIRLQSVAPSGSTSTAQQISDAIGLNGTAVYFTIP